MDERDGLARPEVAVALSYLGALTVAELVTALLESRVGLLFHGMLLTGLLVHTAFVQGQVVHRLLLSLSFVPLTRLLSLWLPVAGFQKLCWPLIISIPLLVGTMVAMQLLELSWREVGFSLRHPLVELAAGSAGLALGFIEYRILRPDPLIERLTLRGIWWPSLVLLIGTGVSEELIFRGVIQRTASEVLGRWGVVYAASLFTAMCIGYRSLANAVFVLGVGVIFGWFRHLTGSILGVSLAHGLTNVMLFVVMPVVDGW